MSNKYVKHLSIVIPLFCLAILSAPVNGAVLITDFGSSQFTIDGDTTSFATVNQSPTSVTLSGTDLNIFAGTFSSVDISSQTAIQLTAQISGSNPGSKFKVELFDSSFSVAGEYEGFLSNFSTTASALTLDFVLSGPGSFTDIIGFQYSGQGTGVPVNGLNLMSVTAVPEPSTWVLITIGLFCGLILFRNRSASRRAV